MTTPPTISERLRAALALLAAPFPDDAIERTKAAVTRKGYDTTGYGYQWIVDRMNEALGIEGWRATATYEVEESATNSGKRSFDVTAHVKIEIGGVYEAPGVEPRWVLWTARECIGGHTSLSRADGMKGAYTNGFKKTAALLGCGAGAYRGTIDDDSVPLPEERGEPRRPPEKAQPKPAEKPRLVSPPSPAPVPMPEPSTAGAPPPGVTVGATGGGGAKRLAPGETHPALAPAGSQRVTVPSGAQTEAERLIVRLVDLAKDPPFGLGAAKCRQILGATPMDTIPRRQAAVRILESALLKAKAGNAASVELLRSLAERADLSEADCDSDARDRYGRPVSALTASELAESCERLQMLAERLEREIAGAR